MNTDALYLHVASELGTNVCLFSSEGRFLKQYSKRIDLKDPLREEPATLSFLFGEDARIAPVLSTINSTITYGLVANGATVCLIGPVLTDASVGILRNMNHISGADDFIGILNRSSLRKLISHLLLLHNCFNSPSLSTLEFFNLRFAARTMEEAAYEESVMDLFIRREAGDLHNPLDHELRLLRSIEEGNLESLKRCMEEEPTGKLGVTAKDPIRNGKNLANAMIVLSSRAAIRGGLHYETAFSMCDAFEMQVEDLKDMSQLEALVKNAEISFSKMVKEIHLHPDAHTLPNHHPVLTECLNYISTNLHSKLTVQEIAAALHVHPNYLSSLFTQKLGISLYQYILNEKIQTAKKLLVYSSFSPLEIAHYLGFTSQSHLGSHFKRAEGCSMIEYRKHHQQKT